MSFMPAAAHAGVLADILASFTNTASAAETPAASSNVQTMTLLRPAMNFDPSAARGGGDVTIVDSTALMPSEGPSGTLADISKPKNGTISTYVVREGDTLSGIAKLFKVSPSTILWANDLSSTSKLQIGQKLTILPVTGVKYTVKHGDTLASIAKKFGGSTEEIARYNGTDSDSLSVGDEIIIPDGELAATPTKKSVSTKIGAEPAHNVGPTGNSVQIGYYIAPLAHYVETQGIHGYNAVDLGASSGTPIYASAAGMVIIAREGGWNGGYGSYVVISHDNGSQTLYSHMSSVAAFDGEAVTQGQVIGYVGATGKATGPHLHFEIRNGIRNPF
ncbi:M23 family metallopeptidase [Candidatus Kaiserbacteria bacterium]|nr:M23 family metallopeptidase [Candidatus Kaiserbacteria bacterium]